ncbi:polysaccharide deacetylase family protein [Edaphobacter sp. 4G125]|nr:polysaccharide deacetylase family protein [Edaphobacter sp. 4G125]
MAAGGTLAWAALSPGSQIFGKTLIAPSTPNEFALTFDDGPNPEATPRLLEVLASAGVQATFFVIGSFAKQCPALIREIAGAGHLVGNHTLTHPWLAWQTEKRIREELGMTSSILEDVLGEPVHYFRAPHGARRPIVLRAARELGMVSVQWNAMGYDWRTISADAIASHVEKGVARNRRMGRGSNILLHDGGHTGLGAPRLETVRAVEKLIQKHRDVKFVRVDAWG